MKLILFRVQILARLQLALFIVDLQTLSQTVTLHQEQDENLLARWEQLNLTALHMFLLSFQNADVTSEDLISRKIRVYNMMRYTGLRISLSGSAIVLIFILNVCSLNVNIWICDVVIIYIVFVIAIFLVQCTQQQV